jgi:hypothetical protein
MKNLKTIIAVKTIKGTSFVCVRNYTNSKGEVSNQTFVVGINYAKLLQNDLEKMKSLNLAYSQAKSLLAIAPKETVVKGYNELVTSLEKRTASEKEKAELLANGDKTIKASVAQTEAYTPIAKGLKAKEGLLYINGLMVRKTILKSGEYKATKSQAKTIAKNKMKKIADLRELKYRNFKLGSLENLAIQGVVI